VGLDSVASGQSLVAQGTVWISNGVVGFVLDSRLEGCRCRGMEQQDFGLFESYGVGHLIRPFPRSPRLRRLQGDEQTGWQAGCASRTVFHTKMRTRVLFLASPSPVSRID